MNGKRMTRIFAVLVAGCVILCLFAGCGGGETGAGKVYYLNFKPEQKAAWEQLAKTYTDQTGVPVTVVTAASGTYEDTLSAEIVKDNPPTLFQVNGPVGLSHWKEYCYDLKDTDLYRELTSKEFALTDGDKVLGIAYVLETYGIIYNKKLLDRYFAADWSTVKRLEDINGFSALSKVAAEIQAHREALGVKGAFTSAGMTDSSDWRFKNHLANLPIYYEYEKRGIDTAEKIDGTYLDNYRQIWDLYLNNATCAPTEIGAKTGDDAVSEFRKGEAVFYQNGTWSHGEIVGDKVSDEDLGMLPLYIGAEGEENQGLCTGSENYWCVNAEARDEDIQETLKFLKWVVTSETGTRALAEEMGFSVPFKAAKKSDNPLTKAAEDMVAAGKKPVGWNFTTIPSEDWKDGVGAALLSYAQTGLTDEGWEKVKTAFVNGWATEYAKNH